MERMSINSGSPRRNYRDSLQLTNFIFNSGATCDTTPKISDFIPDILVETDKYISKYYLGI